MNTTISSSLNYKFGFMAFAALLLALPFWQPQLAAAEEPLVIFGPSDADSIALLNGITGFRNRFWWNHTNLTVAVSAAPNVDPLLVEAIHDAIGTWRTVLASRLPIVSLTDVTDTARIQQRADVVVHYVPKAGGIRFTGVANCGVQNCLNLMVRSDLLDHNDRAWPDFDPPRVYTISLHEIGHALGLGHAVPLEQSQDLMGYGWLIPGPDPTPILSDCDLKGIAAVFEWASKEEAPHPATITSVTCR